MKGKKGEEQWEEGQRKMKKMVLEDRRGNRRSYRDHLIYNE